MVITEFVALFLGAGWLRQVSEPVLKLGSYLLLTKCLSFLDHLLAPDFWHHFLEAVAQAAEWNNHSSAVPSCLVTVDKDVCVPSRFLWWPKGDHADGTWSTIPTAHLCMHQWGGTWEHPVLPWALQPQRFFFSLKESVPRVNSWLA